MTKIIYLVVVTAIHFTAVRNEGGVIEVKSYEKTEEHSFLSRSDAIDMYQKHQALSPYLGYKKVELDSVYICKADTKKTPKP